jgi:hypothetical protein
MKLGLQIGIRVKKEYLDTQKGYKRVRGFSRGYQKSMAKTRATFPVAFRASLQFLIVYRAAIDE